MWYLEGQGPGEKWGVRSRESTTLQDALILPPPSLEPVTFDSSEATVYSPCLRLTIQKMENSAGDSETPPINGFQWNDATGEWDGMFATLLNAATWEGYGTDGPSAGLSAEVNVKGKLIYGYNWRVRDIVYPQGTAKTGWYRLTFSLDGTAAAGKACSSFALNTSLAGATIVTSEEEPTVIEAEEPRGYTPVVDSERNLTYIDVFIQRQVGSGGGGSNTPPVCDAGLAYEQACTGITTNVFLSGANSSDLEDALGYTWSHDCEAGTINDASLRDPVLGLINPGLGIPQSCTVTLTVKELGVMNPQSATCSAAVDVAACNLDCFNVPLGEAVIDECGVCDGNNACFDCFGVPFGTARLDRCNVCDGDGNSCLGCFPQDNQLLLGQIEEGQVRMRAKLQRALREMRRIKNNKAYGKADATFANGLLLRNQEILGDIPSISQLCSNSTFCQQIETSDSMDEHMLNMQKLYQLVLKYSLRLEKNGESQLGRLIRRRANALYGTLTTYGQLLPKTTSDCS